MNALIPFSGIVSTHTHQFLKNGVSFSSDITFDEWLEVFKKITFAKGAIHFWIGDALNFGEEKFGEQFSQALDALDFDYGTIANDKWVCARVPQTRRRETLPFATHLEVAKLDTEEQETLLRRAEEEGLTSKELRVIIKAREENKTLHREPPKFTVLYCSQCAKWHFQPEEPELWGPAHE